MHRTIFPAAALVAATLSVANVAVAADIDLLNAHPEGCTAMLTGQITTGDTTRLRALLGGDAEGFASRFINDAVTFCLDSPGGNLLEGLKLAQEMRHAGIQTHVPAGATCLSACALAFLGGSRLGAEDAITHRFQRSIHATARLGFHAPGLEFDAGSYTEKQIKDAFTVAIKATAEVFSRLDELGITRQFALDFFAVAEGTFYEIDTPERVEEVGIGVTGLAPLPRRIPNDRIVQICGMKFETFGTERYEDPDLYVSIVRRDLMDLPADPPLSQRSALMLATTAEGTLMWDVCEVRWQADAVDIFGPSLQLRHHVLEDFDFLEFRNPKLPSRQSVLNELTRPAADTANMSPLLASAPGASLKSLASGQQPHFEGISAVTCAPIAASYEVHQVQNFSNLRAAPGYTATVLKEVPKGARVTPQSPDLQATAILTEKCDRACRPAERGSIQPGELWETASCLRSDDVWWHVRANDGVTGWMSSKYLKR
ncbi:hypothetical protein [Antarctobacter jejuensis]|uniref:hypothetical protein n=1 Tax=Antarctobacter jejuensis TaxID=1439938 RepID=UPI003FD5871C